VLIGLAQATANATAPRPPSNLCQVKVTRDNYLPVGSDYLGRLAYVTYRPFGSSRTKTVRGRIISERFDISLDVFDESAGRVHKFYLGKFGDSERIRSLWVEPKSSGWRALDWLTPKRARTLGDRAVVLRLETRPHEFHVSGQLTTTEQRKGNAVYQIRDAAGRVLEFERGLVQYLRVLVTPTPAASSALAISDLPRSLRIVDDGLAARRDWMRKLLGEVKRSGVAIYENHRLYEYLARNLADTRQLLTRWYADPSKSGTPFVDRVFPRIEAALGREYVVLLADPGIASRAEDFIRFLRAHRSELKGQTPWQVRRRYARELERTAPKRVFYRAIGLRPEEAKRIRKSGLLSATFRELSPTNLAKAYLRQFSPYERHGANAADLGPLAELNHHQGLGGGQSSFLSASAHPEFAAAVAEKFRKRGQQVYLFELAIPEISIVRPVSPFDPSYEGERIRVGTKVFDLNDDVEVFVPNLIPPGMIKRVTKVRQRYGGWKFV
jgi:hypothetical protein